MIAHASSALRRAGALATRRPATAVWTLLALVCALFLVGVAGTAAAAIDRWAAAHPGRGGALVVYLGDGVGPARAAALVGELRALQGVERAELVPAADAARRLTRALGSDAALLDGVDVASLPASIEVTLAPGVGDVIAMSPTLRALRGAPGVADVVVNVVVGAAGDDLNPGSNPGSSPGADSGADSVTGVLATARSAAWVGAMVFAGLALVIALAAIRIRLERSPREAAVLHLLGAAPGFAAVPSALAGALHGAIAAALAGLALVVATHSVPTALVALELIAPPAGALAGLIGLGALVGLIGGGLAGLAGASRAP
ncbi:MAG TPA: permease-like cell division protein FtsX [Kofleriaceae bacterium]|nr:permease-like cell division protein FtsX [Kofleriaceae bacterium]